MADEQLNRYRLRIQKIDLEQKTCNKVKAKNITKLVMLSLADERITLAQKAILLIDIANFSIPITLEGAMGII